MAPRQIFGIPCHQAPSIHEIGAQFKLLVDLHAVTLEAWTTMLATLTPKQQRAIIAKHFRTMCLADAVHTRFLKLISSLCGPCMKALPVQQLAQTGNRAPELALTTTVSMSVARGFRFQAVVVKLCIRRAFDSVSHSAIFGTLVHEDVGGFLVAPVVSQYLGAKLVECCMTLKAR
jgi:hypothetical protein